MPKVGKKKFPYSRKGRSQARAFAKKSGIKMKMPSRSRNIPQMKGY